MGTAGTKAHQTAVKNLRWRSNEIFEESGGDGDVSVHSEPESGLGGDGPTGEEFSDDEEHLAKRYPKLWARFGENPLPHE